MILALDGEAPVLEGDGHFVAESAALIGRVVLAPGASVWFNAVVRADNDRILIGRESNVQDGAILHTDPGIELLVGDRVTVGHRAVLHGCTVGNRSLIGIGSTVLNHAAIGADSIVGAQALVTEGKRFPDGVLIMGAPARVARELDGEEIAMLERSADTYLRQAERYRSGLAVAS